MSEDPVDQENLAEEWDTNNDESLDRVLSQDEIDSLLGGDNGASNQAKTGINFLINNSKISHERLPMLEVAFDRLVRNLTTSLRNFTSSTVDLSVDEMTSVRFGDYLDTVPLPALLTVFKAEEWESLCLLYVDTGLVYTLVDVLLGGQRETMDLKVEGRPFTSIERNLVKDLVNIVLHDYSLAFSSISPVRFVYERMETTPRFAAIVRPVDAAILVNLNINIEGRSGGIQFCIPYASIEPVREQIVQMFMGEKSGQDNIWENHLEHEVWDADAEIDAILGTAELPLSEVLNWQQGSQLVLRTRPHSIIDCNVGGLKVMAGKMGRRDGYVSVRVEENSIRRNLQSILNDNSEKNTA